MFSFQWSPSVRQFHDGPRRTRQTSADIGANAGGWSPRERESSKKMEAATEPTPDMLTATTEMVNAPIEVTTPVGWYVSNVSIIFDCSMLLYYLFWMLMCFILHFNIIFGINLLTGGPTQIAVFLPISVLFFPLRGFVPPPRWAAQGDFLLCWSRLWFFI